MDCTIYKVKKMLIKMLIEVYDKIEAMNKPISLEGMSHFNGEPAYFKHFDAHGWKLNGWHIITYYFNEETGMNDIELENNLCCDLSNYGKTWLAYRFDPDQNLETNNDEVKNSNE